MVTHAPGEVQISGPATQYRSNRNIGRDHAGRESATGSPRPRAADSILDRGYGRPAQAVINANVASKSARDYTDDELIAIIESQRAVLNLEEHRRRIRA